MSQYLADKVVIVTGAGSGFGRLIAHRCAAGGARVVGVDVNADNLDETISRCLQQALGDQSGYAP